MKVIYFDTETTGLDCQSCKIIELAMITVIDDEIVDRYDEFIDIGEPLPLKITQITGITDKMLKGRKTESEVANDLKDMLTPGTLMIAHNAQFDLSFIYNLLKRHYQDDADSIVGNLDWIDTLTVFKDRAKYPHKLCDAVEHYGIPEVNFHRAIDDTIALHEVTKAMIQERDDLKEYKNVFGYNPKYGVSGEEFSFIKYKKQFYNNFMVPSSRILPNR
ncbi:MAG: 3'-5' exonuclease [Methanobrevibacter thaueri]|jgi:DNA polymerase III epsilon subunit family exonuclease|uniref:3'-5' exonuclease n=1 Tax=Methanobrevibacter thaueri TaxID=190975 RepID=UPI0026EBAD51|nr:3'-5' exonuclease [Methanobrevibacter thaueri]MBE6495170.1 3'-5' exonuclease [Methanobrevibacter thaueri]